MDGAGWNAWAEGASFGLGSGMAVIPYVLLRHYRKLKLSDQEVLLLIHLISFKQVEHKDFPTLEELQEVMGVSAQAIAQSLQKLLKAGMISIDEELDELRNIQYERYNLSGLFEKLGVLLVDQRKNRSTPASRPHSDRRSGAGGGQKSVRRVREGIRTAPVADGTGGHLRMDRSGPLSGRIDPHGAEGGRICREGAFPVHRPDFAGMEPQPGQNGQRCQSLYAKIPQRRTSIT